jgi:aminopeptidase-like protein
MSVDTGRDMHNCARELFPICRSITGEGVRQTLSRMQKEVPLEIKEVETGTRVFDWHVPLEWNIDRAYIEDAAGNRVVDFADNNLHVVSYSEPVDAVIELRDLESHLHVDTRNSTWIPYRTSYYSRNWGFCLSEQTREAMQPGKYRTRVDASLEQGSMSYGELYIPGRSKYEILLYSHTCHPSLANDNLSGLVVTAWLAKYLLEKPNKFSYRFVWGPGTIGSVTWLARNESKLHRIRHALVCCLLGRPGALHYKRSPSGSCEIDELVNWLLSQRDEASVILDFDPYGYDERQFCSPGIRLPTGRISRLPNDMYPEYHSSADDMNLVKPETLADSLHFMQSLCDELDSSVYYRNSAPKCEPQLGRRGLYGTVGGRGPKDRQIMMLWLLNQSDGKTSLQRISRRTGFSVRDLNYVARELEDAGLLVNTDAE